jgi:hypothetical protein
MGCSYCRKFSEEILEESNDSLAGIPKLNFLEILFKVLRNLKLSAPHADVP